MALKELLLIFRNETNAQDLIGVYREAGIWVAKTHQEVKIKKSMTVLGYLLTTLCQNEPVKARIALI